MTFNKENVLHALNADKADISTYGYFSNDIESLERAVKTGRRNLHTVYDRLRAVLKPSLERRFCAETGNFSLYYPIDKINEQRN